MGKCWANDRLSIPFAIEADTRSKPYGWRYALNMHPANIPGLTTSEALTLVLLETYLKTLLPVAIADNLTGHFAAAKHAFSVEHSDSKLQSWLKKVKVLSPGQQLLAPTIDTNIQRTVYNALMQGYQVEMDYLATGNAVAKHYGSVHIQGLVQYGTVIYLVVTINEYQDIRLLVLHRIQKVSLKDELLCPLEHFDLQAYIDQGGFGFGGIAYPIELVAIFKNGSGHHLIETPLAKDQKIRPIDPQTLEIKADVLDTPQLVRWLSSFGPDIEVLAPESLRETMAERHRFAAQQYIK
jgi:predicted DNA-binding transcriptional regulator YafY